MGFDDGEEGGCRLFFRTISVKNINRDRGGLHIPQQKTLQGAFLLPVQVTTSSWFLNLPVDRHEVFRSYIKSLSCKIVRTCVRMSGDMHLSSGARARVYLLLY